MKTDNELIAEFMGMRIEKLDIPSGKDWYRGFCFYPEYRNIKEWSCGSSTKEGVEELLKSFKHQYDTSWDWLMPVVEKIESIRHIGIDAVYFQIKGHQAQIWTYFDVKEFLRLTGDDKNDGNKFKVGVYGKTKIEAVYGAVVEFIKWFNQQSNG